MSNKEDIKYCIETLNIILSWGSLKETDVLKLEHAIKLLKGLEILK